MNYIANASGHKFYINYTVANHKVHNYHGSVKPSPDSGQFLSNSKSRVPPVPPNWSESECHVTRILCSDWLVCRRVSRDRNTALL